MLIWPHAQTDWRTRLEAAETQFAAIAAAISRYQPVLLVCLDQAGCGRALEAISSQNGITANFRFFIAPSNDTWARDTGPVTIIERGRPTLLNFRFNAWGNKYPATEDDALTQNLYAQDAFGDTPLETSELVLEGGALEFDGAGTLLATRHCLLNPNRNPEIAKSAVLSKLEKLLGVKRFLWLDHGGLEGDDTDGHIDTLARFCDTRTIAYQACDETGYSHYADLQAMAQQLAQLRDPENAPYSLKPLPWPAPQYDEAGQRLPASYANFLIINGAVLVPTYNDPADDTACSILAECFPGRDIVAIDCCTLVRQFGSLHCVTMQIPAGVLPEETVIHDKR